MYFSIKKPLQQKIAVKAFLRYGSEWIPEYYFLAFNAAIAFAIAVAFGNLPSVIPYCI